MSSGVALPITSRSNNVRLRPLSQVVKVEKRKRKAPTSMDSYRSRSSMESTTKDHELKRRSSQVQTFGKPPALLVQINPIDRVLRSGEAEIQTTSQSSRNSPMATKTGDSKHKNGTTPLRIQEDPSPVAKTN